MSAWFRGLVFATGLSVFLPTSAQDIPVTTTLDNMPGSLRAAIQQANAQPGAQRIVFQHVLTENDCGADDVFFLESPLPAIIDSLVIDGYTANLSDPAHFDSPVDATICVRLQPAPNALVPVPVGLRVPDVVPWDVSLEVSGLKFNGFSVAGIELAGGAIHVITRNVFGGGDAPPNGYGLLVGAEASLVWVGDSPYVADSLGNWFGGTSIAGIFLGGDTVHSRDNVISPDASNSPWSRNAVGMVIAGKKITSVDAVVRSTGDNVVVSGEGAIENQVNTDSGANGIHVLAGSGRVDIYSSIYRSAGAGVRVEDGAGPTSIAPQSDFDDNGGLGIDLGPAGVTPNDIDALAPVGEANGGQNFPVLSAASAKTTASNGVYVGSVSGSLSSRPGLEYRIQLYVNDVCDGTHGEGRLSVNNAALTLGPAQTGKDATGTFVISMATYYPLVGKFITAVATSSYGTSEFSECLQVGIFNQAPALSPQTYVVSADNNGALIQLGTLVAVDDHLPDPPGVLAFSMGAQNVPFSVTSSGVLSGQPDFSVTPSGYQFTVIVSDGEKTADATIRVLPDRMFRSGFE